MVKRTRKKRNLTLDITVVVTTEEALFDTKKEKVKELLGARMAISDSNIDKENEDEREK